MLTAVGVAPGEIVLGINLPVQLEISLVGIDKRRCGVELVEPDSGVHWQRIKVRAVEQILYGISEEALWNLVVGEWSPVSAGVERKRIIELDRTVRRIEQP